MPIKDQQTQTWRAVFLKLLRLLEKNVISEPESVITISDPVGKSY